MGNTVQIAVIAADFEDATTEYTSNIERRVVGGVLPETPDNSPHVPEMVRTKAPLLNNTRSNWMMEEFHLPRFRK